MEVTSIASVALEAAKLVANPSGYLITQIAAATSKNVAKSESSSNEISDLRLEAERQELEMRIAEAQAKVAQEVAIARRIESAEEVEMEEFYEYANTGKGGAKVAVESVSIEGGASTRRVTKRVYRFKGTVRTSGTSSDESQPILQADA